MVGGIALSRDGAITDTAVEITQVHFRRGEPATLDWYVSTGEWQGRAGGYAIQGAGAALVAGIEGDYLNVVGLPLGRLLDLLPELLQGAGPFRRAARAVVAVRSGYLGAGPNQVAGTVRRIQNEPSSACWVPSTPNGGYCSRASKRSAPSWTRSSTV